MAVRAPARRHAEAAPRMSSKRKTLGRGLDALLGPRPSAGDAGTHVAGAPGAGVGDGGAVTARDTADTTTPANGPAAAVGLSAAVGPAPAAPPRDGELRRLPVDALQRGKYQPRIEMHQES